MNKRRVAIDELTTMVANGFHAVQEEMQDGFRALTSRVDGIETELKDHGARLDRIERKLDSTIERVDDYSVRLKRVEKTKR